MKHTNNKFIINLLLPLQVSVLLFFIGFNFVNFNNKTNTPNLNNGNNKTHYLNIQNSHHQNVPVNKNSNQMEYPSINLEEEDDFFTAQYYPEIFCFEVLPTYLVNVIDEEKFIEYYHPELTVPPPKINSFESFC
ncbi:MAG: hypothetical protein ACOVSR_15765 [Bacteroidia bacterium]